MRQTTLSDLEYENRRHRTRRERFLDTMDELIPWGDLIGIIRPYYPAGKRGRPPRDLEKMLRMYLLQGWFQLSAEGAEDAICDSYAMRKFMRIDFLDEQVPDASTLLKFRQLIAKHDLAQTIAVSVFDCLQRSGYLLRKGMILDASIISAAKPEKRSTFNNHTL